MNRKRHRNLLLHWLKNPDSVTAESLDDAERVAWSTIKGNSDHQGWALWGALDCAVDGNRHGVVVWLNYYKDHEA